MKQKKTLQRDSLSMELIIGFTWVFTACRLCWSKKRVTCIIDKGLLYTFHGTRCCCSHGDVIQDTTKSYSFVYSLLALTDFTQFLAFCCYGASFAICINISKSFHLFKSFSHIPLSFTVSLHKTCLTFHCQLKITLSCHILVAFVW